MKFHQIWQVVGWGALVLMLWFLWKIHSELPDRLAVHFDLKGRPNGWMSKSGFMWLMIGLSMIPNLLLRKLKYLPLDKPYVNVPYKQYWLATPKRRAMLKEKYEGLLLLVIALMNCLWVFVGYVVYTENSISNPPPSDPLVEVGVILGATGLLIGYSIWTFLPRD